MRRLIALVMVTGMTSMGLVGAWSARAEVLGPNGQIVFGRFNPDLGDYQIFTANPDGSHRVQLLPGVAECPRWSPSGTEILLCVGNAEGLLRPATVSSDGSGFTLLDTPDPTLNLGCWAWSPDGARVACEGWDDTIPDRRAGIFTVQSNDGSDLVQVTANPYDAHDIPGDYSPDGTRIVFLRNNDPRHDPDNRTGALFVVKTNGTGLRRITTWNFAGDAGTWSPDERWIAFTGPGGKLFVVRPDGSRLHRIILDAGSGRSFVSQPGWSPDGTRLVLIVYLTSTGKEHLYTVRADGSDLQQMASTHGNDEFPDWGPHPLAT
jgi:TolB protein